MNTGIQWNNIFSASSVQYVGLVYNLSLSENNRISILKAFSMKGELHISQSSNSIPIKDKASVKIDFRAKVALTIIGEGILFKKIENGFQGINEALKLAFPFVRSDEFEAQLFPTKKESYVCIAKHQLIEDILNELKALGIFPVSVKIGPFVLAQLASFTKGVDTQITVPGFKVFSSNSEVTGIEMCQVLEPVQSFQAGDLDISGDFCLHLASILYLIKPISILSYENQLEFESSEEFRNRIYYKIGKTASMGFFFLTLLINFWVFAERLRVNTQLREQASASVEISTKLIELDKEYQVKKDLVDSLNLMSQQKIAFYADRLAMQVPTTVRWTTLIIFPEMKGNQPEEIIYNNRSVIVKGICSDQVVLENWKRLIRNQEWVQKIENEVYGYNDMESFGEFEFTINLNP